MVNDQAVQSQSSSGSTNHEILRISNELGSTVESILGVQLGASERASIYDALLLVRTFTPNNHQAALNDMTRCNQSEAGLNYIIYKLEEARRLKSVKYHSLYYTTHSRLSKRASNQAMAQSQTMATVDDKTGKSYTELETEIEEIQNLIDFFRTEVHSIRRKLKTIEAIRFNTF